MADELFALEARSAKTGQLMRATVLLYHDVVANQSYRSSGFSSADADIYKLDATDFHHHLGEIAVHARTPPTTVSRTAEGPDSSKLFVTFDDGGVGSMLAAQMLEEHGWRGHFFMTTDYVGRSGFLNEAQLRDLNTRGHVIGSHSCSHPPRMSRCTAAQLDREWRDSVRRLEAILGSRVETASVPGGYYSRKVAAAAAGAGMRFLFTSEPSVKTHDVDGCTVFGRFSVQQGVPAKWVAAVVEGAVWPRFERWLFWNTKKLLKATGGNVWLAARRNLLARRAQPRD